MGLNGARQVRVTGSDLTFTVVVLNAANEGVTGLTDTDLKVNYWDPVGGQKLLVVTTDFTWSELDSTDAPGWYLLTVLAAAFNDSAQFASIAVLADTNGSFVPMQFQVENLLRWWPDFNQDFDDVANKVTEQVELRGVL